MRNYDVAKGEIGRPKIKNPITAGGMGGVELALRYDWADMSDLRGTTGAAPILAGEFNSYTLGVNYYPTSYVRMMLNYTHAKSDNPDIGGIGVNDYQSDVVGIRTQLDF